ncbi:hypothetical protein BDR07DRAFT_1381182 [Suillus spraguei]|nr:hypothetical protein BDR07DRAFT_1381182 [Suillus spraguei]
MYDSGHRSLKSRTDEGRLYQCSIEGWQHNASPTTWNDADNVEYHEPPMFLDADDPEHVDPVFQVDDIECEYHPSSGITPEALQQVASQQEKFTFENHKDIHERWYTVSHRTTQNLIYTTEISGNEPFTADTFWNIQSQLPLGSKPLAFNSLSSFGTARGYPVVAHLANLPADIHNEQGVKEDRDHTQQSQAGPTQDSGLSALIHSMVVLSYHLNFICGLQGTAEVTAEEKEEKTERKIIVGLGQVKVAQMNKNYEAFPHWQNLKHLTQVMDISFADGSVYKDISKMVIHATHAILMKDDFPLGYLLLCCIHLFLEVDAYAALEVYMTETISAG